MPRSGRQYCRRELRHRDQGPSGPLPDPTLSSERSHRLPGSCSRDPTISPRTENRRSRKPPRPSLALHDAAGVDPAWRLRHVRQAKNEFVIPLVPRLLSREEIGLQEAAIKGLGIVACPVTFAALRSIRSAATGAAKLDRGRLHDSALIPYRQGLLPSVRAFLDHLATEFPKAILI
jgi:hypothetical protein